jgi:hypothetical protein
MPVHVGLGAASRVDVQVIVPLAGRRRVTWSRGVNPRDHHGSTLVVRADR